MGRPSDCVRRVTVLLRAADLRGNSSAVGRDCGARGNGGVAISGHSGGRGRFRLCRDRSLLVATAFWRRERVSQAREGSASSRPQSDRRLRSEPCIGQAPLLPTSPTERHSLALLRLVRSRCDGRSDAVLRLVAPQEPRIRQPGSSELHDRSLWPLRTRIRSGRISDRCELGSRPSCTRVLAAPSRGAQAHRPKSALARRGVCAQSLLRRARLRRRVRWDGSLGSMGVARCIRRWKRRCRTSSCRAHE